jgi:hypothetical protein
MSDNPNSVIPDCPSRTVVDDFTVTCTRDAGHPGVHLGRVLKSDDSTATTEELHQWGDAQATAAPTEPPEIPTWYQVLPLGSDVQITTNSRRVPNLTGQLVGAVVDNDEQISAVMLSEGIPGESEKRVLVPWATVETFAWEVEQ